MLSCKFWENYKKPTLKNIFVRLLLKRLQEMIDQDFLFGESLSKPSRLNINKIPVAFTPELSLNLTPTLYFEPGFPMFVINGYVVCSPWTTKFVVPGLLVLLQIWFAISKYGKDCFSKRIFCKRIKISTSCCYIQVLAVMVTVQQSFSAVRNPVTTVNDR